MGFYQHQVLPRLQDRFMNRQATRQVRARVCRELHGEVVEIGFGTGLNARYYPPGVTKVLAVEPSSVCMRIAEPRIAKSSSAVELAGLDGQRLELPSEAFDAVLSTWTLCTIADLAAALAEVRRVLKPTGTLHFVEHGRAPDVAVRRWQERLEPLNKRLASGCHLTRDIPQLLEASGFAPVGLDTYDCEREPKPFGYVRRPSHQALSDGMATVLLSGPAQSLSARIESSV